MVPTYCRPERLSVLLASLAAQTLSAERFEVLVMDDGSPPRQRAAARDFSANQHQYLLAHAGPAAARNAGAALAQGPLLVFIDDDCAARSDWLEELLAAHRSNPSAMLGGQTTNGLPDNICSATSESLLQFFDDEALEQHGRIDFLASNNLALSTQRFLALGGFDTSYPLAAGEDRDLCRRWLASGQSLQRVPGARVSHFHQLDLARFWKQHHNYGRGAARFHAHAAATPDMDVEQSIRAGFYWRLLVHPLTRRRHWSLVRRLQSTALVLLSQLAIASGLLRERRALSASPSSACGPR